MSTKNSLLAIDPGALAMLVEIIDSGSLSGAALHGATTRSAVSHRLKVLEDALGVQLLRRTTRRIEPTDIGRQLYERGRVIAGELAKAHADVSAAVNEPRGSVRLSIPTGLGEVLISGLLIEFNQRYRHVSIDVKFNNDVNDLLKDKVDLAIRVLDEPPEQLRSIDLGNVDWVLCAAPHYLRRTGMPRSTKDLESHPFVTTALSKGKLSALSPGKSEPVTVDVPIKLRSDNFNFIKQAIVAGLGVSLLPFYLVEAEIGSGQLTSLLPTHRFETYGRRAVLLAVPDRYRTAIGGAMIDFLGERIAKELLDLNKRFKLSTAKRPEEPSSP